LWRFDSEGYLRGNGFELFLISSVKILSGSPTVVTNTCVFSQPVHEKVGIVILNILKRLLPEYSDVISVPDAVQCLKPTILALFNFPDISFNGQYYQ
jgi:hypothetical protein